jgi:hypothetical protein
MTTYRFEAHACPYCHTTLDAAGTLDVEAPRRPEAGDITLCIRCGEWAVFADDQGALRKPTDPELYEIGTSDECRAARTAWVELQRQGGLP